MKTLHIATITDGLSVEYRALETPHMGATEWVPKEEHLAAVAAAYEAGAKRGRYLLSTKDEPTATERFDAAIEELQNDNHAQADWLAAELHALTPADAEAALARMLAEARGAALTEAARFCRLRIMKNSPATDQDQAVAIDEAEVIEAAILRMKGATP